MPLFSMFLGFNLAKGTGRLDFALFDWGKLMIEDTDFVNIVNIPRNSTKFLVRPLAFGVTRAHLHQGWPTSTNKIFTSLSTRIANVN